MGYPKIIVPGRLQAPRNDPNTPTVVCPGLLLDRTTTPGPVYAGGPRSPRPYGDQPPYCLKRPLVSGHRPPDGEPQPPRVIHPLLSSADCRHRDDHSRTPG